MNSIIIIHTDCRADWTYRHANRRRGRLIGMHAGGARLMRLESTGELLDLMRWFER